MGDVRWRVSFQIIMTVRSGECGAPCVVVCVCARARVVCRVRACMRKRVRVRACVVVRARGWYNAHVCVCVFYTVYNAHVCVGQGACGCAN